MLVNIHHTVLKIDFTTRSCPSVSSILTENRRPTNGFNLLYHNVSRAAAILNAKVKLLLGRLQALVNEIWQSFPQGLKDAWYDAAHRRWPPNSSIYKRLFEHMVNCVMKKRWENSQVVAFYGHQFRASETICRSTTSRALSANGLRDRSSESSTISNGTCWEHSQAPRKAKMTTKPKSSQAKWLSRHLLDIKSPFSSHHHLIDNNVSQKSLRLFASTTAVY